MKNDRFVEESSLIPSALKKLLKNYSVLKIIPDSIEAVHCNRTGRNFLIIDSDKLGEHSETNKIVKKLSFNSKVILISSRPKEECRAPFSVFIEKPFTKEHLHNAIKYLELKESLVVA